MWRKATRACGLFLGLTVYPLVAVAQGGSEPIGSSPSLPSPSSPSPSSAASQPSGAAPICETARMVEFKGSSAALSPDAKLTLDQIALAAKDQSTSVRLRGSSGRKGRAAKAKISERRTDAVKGYLAEAGVDPALITATPHDPSAAPVGAMEAVEVVTCARPMAQQAPASQDRAVVVVPVPTPSPSPSVTGAEPSGAQGTQPSAEGQTQPGQDQTGQTAQAPMSPAPWEASGTMPAGGRMAANPVRSRLGIEGMVGGGVIGFLDEQARDLTDPGGNWEARLSVGTRLPVAVEAAYVGSAQNIQALGLDDDAVLVGSAAEAVARVNFTRQLRIQPYIFGGVGWQHYDLTNEDANTSGVREDDDLFTIPAGLGVSFRLVRGLVLDIRGTIRTAFDEELMDAPFAATGQDANLHTWDAGARLGWEF
ncbi:MAG TPA: OmpA family protein [Polyangia bacterium]